MAIVRRFLCVGRFFSGPRPYSPSLARPRVRAARRIFGVVWLCSLAAAFSLLQSSAVRFLGALLLLFGVFVLLGVQYLGYAEFDFAGRLFCAASSKDRSARNWICGTPRGPGGRGNASRVLGSNPGNLRKVRIPAGDLNVGREIFEYSSEDGGPRLDGARAARRRGLRSAGRRFIGHAPWWWRRLSIQSARYWLINSLESRRTRPQPRQQYLWLNLRQVCGVNHARSIQPSRNGISIKLCNTIYHPAPETCA